jgi:4-amino-4-deoxy-L-arabinose transferase-like glycosyltransferase
MGNIHRNLFSMLRPTSMISAALVAIPALTLYLRLLYFGQYIDADVGNLGYLAWRMAEGEVLLDFEGPGKPPLYFMLYSLFIRLFGPSVLGLKMFGTIFVLMAILVLYWLAKEAYGERVGLLSALLFGIFSSAPMVEGGTVNLETLMHLPYILAIGLFLKGSVSGKERWYFLAGLCAALATLVKQVGGVLFFIFLCYGIYELWKGPNSLSRKQLLYRYLLLGGGALLPVMGMILFYHFHGYTLNELYDCMLGSNLRYVKRGYEYTNSWKHFTSTLKIMLPENSILWFGTLSAAVHMGQKAWHGEGVKTDRILLWWGFWSFAVLWVSGTFYAHYFLQIIAPFSLLAAYGIVTTLKWVRSLSSKARFVMQAISITILLVMLALFIKTDYKYFFSYTPEEKTMYQYKALSGMDHVYGLYVIIQNEIASHIRANTNPSETIYVWGIAPQVYFVAQRRAATRYRTNYNMDKLVTGDRLKALMAYAPVVMKDLKQFCPVYIVQIFPLEFLQEFQTFVQDHYKVEMEINLSVPPYRIRLYRRSVDKEGVPNPK